MAQKTVQPGAIRQTITLQEPIETVLLSEINSVGFYVNTQNGLGLRVDKNLLQSLNVGGHAFSRFEADTENQGLLTFAKISANPLIPSDEARLRAARANLPIAF